MPSVTDTIPVSEAVVEFGVSRSMLFKLMKEGQLRAYRRRGDKRTFVERKQLKRVLRLQRIR